MAEGAGTLVQQRLEVLGGGTPDPLPRSMRPRGHTLQTRHAVGIEGMDSIAHGLFAAAPLAGHPWHAGPILAG